MGRFLLACLSLWAVAFVGVGAALTALAGPPSLVNYFRRVRYDPHTGITYPVRLNVDTRHDVVTSPDGRYSVAVDTQFSIVQMILLDNHTGDKVLVPNIDDYVGFGVPRWLPDSSGFVFIVISAEGTAYSTSLAQVDATDPTQGVQRVFEMSEALGTVVSMAPSPGLERYAFWDGTGTLTVWNRAAGAVDQQHTLEMDDEPLRGLAWAGVETLLYGRRGCVYALPTRDDAEATPLACTPSGEGLWGFSTSLGGERLALVTGGEDAAEITVVELVTGEAQTVIYRHPAGVEELRSMEWAGAGAGRYLHLGFRLGERGTVVILLDTATMTVRQLPGSTTDAVWETPGQLRYAR